MALTVIEIHAIFGLIILAASFILLFWNLYRILAHKQGKSYGRILTGLIDLQVLLGILVFLIQPMGGLFLLHPLVMIAAAVVVHVYAKDKQPPNVQLAGYASTAVLIAAGVLIAYHP